jgi:hypothetical protein
LHAQPLVPAAMTTAQTPAEDSGYIVPPAESKVYEGRIVSLCCSCGKATLEMATQ